MMHSTYRHGAGVLLMIGVLGVFGPAAAGPDREPAAGGLGLARLWNLFIAFLDDEVAPPPPDGSGNGDASQGGGAMDPNGGTDPKPTPPPPPPPPASTG